MERDQLMQLAIKVRYMVMSNEAWGETDNELSVSDWEMIFDKINNMDLASIVDAHIIELKE